MSNEAEVKHSEFLETVINLVKETEPKQAKNNQDFTELYGEANTLINKFDVSIDRCKRYNEAKINRKYQMIITDLEKEIRKLNQKLKIEQDARSPTKKHVTDILDQLVTYKQQNQRLKKQLSQTRRMVQEMEEKNQTQSSAIRSLQKVQPRALVERLPSINSKGTVAEAIKQYIKDKENVRKITNASSSAFEKFLQNNVIKSWNWTIGTLLQEADKWGEGIKTTKPVDMWKIRSSVAKSFSEYIDDSKSLTRPSSLIKTPQQMLSPMGSEKKPFLHKKQSRFSIVSERKQKSGFY